MGRWAFALVLALALATSVHAQVGRMLPANGKLGELAGRQQPFPLIQIAGKVMRLSPGALIFDANNRTILHNALPERAQVLYVAGVGEEVTRIYILRPEELELVQRRER
jgi:hypothetical protein